ncbi:MAG: right-handed parallel beta-helix repeat-containing protein, partial [Thermoplasmata archaeon]
MNRKIVAIWMSLIMLLGFIVIVDITIDFIPTSKGTTLYVNKTGSDGAYTSIQDAINASNDGDSVFVYNGAYYEDVIVNKTINLTGEDKHTTKINGSGLGDVIDIIMDWVNITGFNITGSGSDPGDAGIQLDNVQYCRIDNNNLSNNCYGIYIMNRSSNNTIIDCRISNSSSFGAGIYISNSDDIFVTNCSFYNTSMRGIELLYSSKARISNSTIINGYYGISAYDSPNNTILNCSFKDGTIGIRLSLSPNCTLKNNSISNNMYNLEIAGAELYDFFQDIEGTNTINGKPIYYLVEQSDLEFNETMNVGYLGLVSCVNITVRNLTLSGNGHAVLLVNTTDSLVDNTGCFNNRWGVSIWKSSNNRISNCSFDFNYWANIGIEHQSVNNTVYNCTVENNPNQFGGILIEDSQNNQILQSTIYNNKYGIYIAGSSVNNILQANTVTWNDYDGIHLDSVTNNSVISNNISKNRNGLCLISSSNNNIATNNIVMNDERGISLSLSNDNNFDNSNIWNNTIGIYLDSSQKNNITNN